MPPRTSPSSQNPGPGGSVPGANNPAQPQTPAAGAAPAPAGLNPDPNPKVVVRAINPPLTPDQVVSQAETPASASLPEIKLEKIKIPRVQNKSIVGYLKAIEAKMTATEKLMKDVVKLQNLQIVTQKELHERKRELYQNTFEEYLIDKTIGFGDDPDDPDCTCINLPKKPDGGFPFGGGKKRRRRQRQPVNAPIAIPIPIKEPVTEREGSDEGEGLPARPKTEPRTPQVPREEEDPFRLPDFPQFPVPLPPIIPINPFEFDPFEFPLPMGAAAELDPIATFNNPDLQYLNPEEATRLLTQEIDGQQTAYGGFDPKQDPAIADVEEFRTWIPQDQVPSPLLAFVPDALKAYEANGKRTTSVNTPHGTLYVGFKNTFDRTPVFKYLTNTGNTQRMAETAKTLDNPFVSSVLTGTQGLNFIGDLMIGTRGGVGAASRGPYGINSFRRGKLKPINFNIPNLNLRSNLTTQYSRARTGLTDLSTNLKNRLTRDPNNRRPTIEEIMRNAEDGFNPYSARARDDVMREDFNMDLDTIIRRSETGTTIQRGDIQQNQLDLLNQPTKKQASGGISSTNLYDSSAKQYFRSISNDMTIPNFGGGGLVNWWNMGRNMRVPTENTASWRTLMADDAQQLTRTNKAFKSGATGIRGWNPIKAFTPEMVKTGPTPAVRQAFERPVRAIRDNIIRSTVVRAAKPILAPLVKPLVAASALILATPTPAGGALYGPGAVDPKYRNVTSREEYDKLEAAQSNMMQSGSGNTPQVVPLPPNYIQIPGRKKKAQTKTKTGFNAPGIDIEQSPFGRSDTTLDSSFNGMFGF